MTGRPADEDVEAVRAVKTCSKCRETKPLDDFYRNRTKAAGRQNWCKPCTREKDRAYQERTLDARRALYRAWANANRPRIRSLKEAWRQRNREKCAANDAVRRAVARGQLERPSVCSRCGAEGIIHGHHEDYSKKLEVVWLCPLCHKQAHRAAALAAAPAGEATEEKETATWGPDHPSYDEMGQ